MKYFHVRTRAGLAGLGAALALVLCSLYDSNAQFLPGIPMAIVWVFILMLTWFWLIAAIWRNRDLKNNHVSLVLSALLLYPIIAPVVALTKTFSLGGPGLAGFSINVLNESPEFLTNMLPLFIWPQTFLAFLIPLLAAFFLLKDQISAFRASEPGSKHLGGLWLSLAGLVVLVFSFLSFPQVSSDYPSVTAFLKGLWPTAAQYSAQLEAEQAKALAQDQALTHSHAKVQTAPAAPIEPAQDQSQSGQNPPAPAQAPAQDSGAAGSETAEVSPPPESAPAVNEEAQGPPSSEPIIEPHTASAEEAASEPQQTAQAAASSEEASLPASEETSEPASEPAEPAEVKPAAAQTAQLEVPPTDAASASSITSGEISNIVPPKASPAEAISLESLVPPASAATLSDQAADDIPDPLSVTVTSLEVGHSDPGSVPQDPVSTFVIHEDPSQLAIPAEKLAASDASDQIRLLTEENTTLKNNILILEAQNELLKERLKYNDQLIINLTTNPR
jgi:hypothetical protein